MSSPPVAPAPLPSAPPRRRHRPQLLDQTATPLIPLRPLTIGEAMDAAFLLVRRDARSMLGVPAVVALLAAAYVACSALIVTAVGNSHVAFAALVVGVLLALLGLGLLALVVSWLQFIYCRSALRTVFGDDVASARPSGLRRQLRLLGPALTYVVYLWVATSVASSAASGIMYALMLVGMMSGIAVPPTVALVALLGCEFLGFVLLVWALSWTSLVVPIYVAESEGAPEWVGLPTRRTGILQAIGRNFTLLGFRNSFRVAVANLGGLVGSYALSVVILIGVLLGILSYVQQLYLPLPASTASVLWLGVAAVVWLLAMVVFLAYFAALQTVFYLDLRMRREGLDLALRFSMVPVPEPNQLGVL